MKVKKVIGIDSVFSNVSMHAVMLGKSFLRDTREQQLTTTSASLMAYFASPLRHRSAMNLSNVRLFDSQVKAEKVVSVSVLKGAPHNYRSPQLSDGIHDYWFSLI